MNFFTLKHNSFLTLLFVIFAMSFSHSAYACDDLTSPGTIEGNQTLNSAGTPSALSNVVSASGGASTAAVEYLWMFSTITSGTNTALWTTIPGATGANYQPGVLNETTSFRRCARRNGCNVYSNESNIITVNVTNALPVELIDFSGKTKGQNVVLAWATASELNNDFFAVEHSVDGTNFREFETVNSDGVDSQDKKEYAMTHYDAVTGINFYRLRQVDFDGKMEYSNVIQVEINSEIKIQTSPNPTIYLMTVKLSELQQTAAVLTFHHAQSGQQVQTVTVAEGQTSLQINTEDFVPGMYVVQVLSNNGARLAVSKFMKAHR